MMDELEVQEAKFVPPPLIIISLSSSLFDLTLFTPPLICQVYIWFSLCLIASQCQVSVHLSLSVLYVIPCVHIFQSQGKHFPVEFTEQNLKYGEKLAHTLQPATKLYEFIIHLNYVLWAHSTSSWLMLKASFTYSWGEFCESDAKSTSVQKFWVKMSLSPCYLYLTASPLCLFSFTSSISLFFQNPLLPFSSPTLSLSCSPCFFHRLFSLFPLYISLKPFGLFLQLQF